MNTETAIEWIEENLVDHNGGHRIVVPGWLREAIASGVIVVVPPEQGLSDPANVSVTRIFGVLQIDAGSAPGWALEGRVPMGDKFRRFPPERGRTR